MGWKKNSIFKYYISCGIILLFTASISASVIENAIKDNKKSFEEIPDQYWKHFSELEMDNLQYGYGNPNKVRFVGKDLKIINVTKEFYK